MSDPPHLEYAKKVAIKLKEAEVESAGVAGKASIGCSELDPEQSIGHGSRMTCDRPGNTLPWHTDAVISPVLS